MMSERTILVADDNGPLRELFVQQLREYYRVRGVGSGDALLDVLDPSVAPVEPSAFLRSLVEASAGKVGELAQPPILEFAPQVVPLFAGDAK